MLGEGDMTKHRTALIALACSLTVVLAIAAPVVTAGALFGDVLVYVFAAPAGSDTFQAIPRALSDSVTDLQRWMNTGSLFGGLHTTRAREKARIVVQITAREAVDGEFRVHAHVTADGHASDLVGTSTHQWKQSAGDLVDQLAAWAHAHPEPSPHQKALIDAGVK